MKRTLATIITMQLSTIVPIPGQDAPKPVAIRTDGVPELSRDLLQSLKPYQEVRTASFVDWHPKGGILVASRIDNLHRLYHVPSAGAPPVRITGGEEPVTRGRCLPGGEIVFQVGSGGDENFQIEISGGPGQPSKRLTDGKSRNVFGAPDRSGRRLPFNSTRRNGRDLDLYLLDLDRPASPELLFEVAEENWSVEDWSQDGSRALLLHYVSANDARVHVLDIASRERKPLPLEDAVRSAPATRVSRDVPRFGPGSRKVYYASDARGQFRELVCMDPGTGREEWLTGDLPHDVEDLDVSRDGRRAAFSVNADGFSRLFIIDLEILESKGADAARSARKEVNLGRCVISGIRFSPDSTRLGFTLGRASSPAEAHGYELGSGGLTRWTVSERAGFRDEDFTEPELIRYRSFDDLEVPAFLYVPRRPPSGEKRLPVIVLIHGGPESQVRPNFSSRIQYYVRELGAAVITPNVRGSTGYGKKYSLLDNGVLREDSVRDIGALFDWVSRDDRFDPSRVAVIGGSYGGYMVLASLVRFGSRIRAGVDIVGVSDFNTLLRNTSAYRRELRRAEYGDERDPAMQAFFEKISPAKRMDSIRSALLIIHGANDPRVPLSEAEQIVERARRSGNPVWTLYAQNEGHGFTRRENTDYEEAATVEFLRRHLLASRPDEVGARPGPEDGPALHEKAIDLFHRKDFSAAVAEFDRAIRAGGRTHTADACWERGLALYYAGEPEKAREQFDAYHKVDPLDIENGLWRYLCVAARDGTDKAREALPAYERRTRAPFPALLDLYGGRGSIDAVIQEASAGATGARLDENLFYAHFYVAKHLQAKKDAAARAHLEKALAKPVDHFMYACAKIEAER